MKQTVLLIIIFLLFSVTLSSQDKKEEKQPQSFQELIKEVNTLWRTQKKQEALNLYQSALELYPDHSFQISQQLAHMYLRLGKKDECFSSFEYGHKKGFYYPLYTKSGPMAALMKIDRFKKIVAKNNQLLSEAQVNTKLQYEIVTPENYDKNKSYPVFIILHGWSGNMSLCKPIWKLQELNGTFIIAYLQSSQLAGMYAYAWNDAKIAKNDISKLYNHLISNYSVDKERVVIGGFSQGGAMAITAATENIIPVAGFFAHCPGGEHMDKIMDNDLAAAAKKGLRAVILTTERDHSKKSQETLINRLRTAKIATEYSEIKGIGHWYPKDFSAYLEKGLKYIFQQEL